MMKLLISVVDPSLDSPLDPRFGRAEFFLEVDPQTMDFQAFSNPALQAKGGAGIKAAQIVVDHACKGVISGDFGPNAFEALQMAGVEMYLFGSSKTARQAIQAFLSGELEMVVAPTASGHHSR